MSKYKCNACGKVVKRQSSKRWMRSYCENTDKDVRIYRVKKIGKKMNRKKYFVRTQSFGNVQPPEIICEFELYGRRYFCSRAFYTVPAIIGNGTYKFYDNLYSVTESETGSRIGIDFNNVEDCIVYAMFLIHAYGKREVEKHINVIKKARLKP